MERVHLGLAPGNKADMSSPRIRIAPSEPEENATVPSKALEVGMSFGTILTVVIDDMRDAERLEGRLVEGDRLIEILDGYEDVVEQEFTSFVSRFLLNRHSPRSREASVTGDISTANVMLCGQLHAPDPV